MVIAASMITWGVGVTVFMDLAESVARARDSALLKRMRGTPISAGYHLAVRTIAGLVLAVVILVLGAVVSDLRIGGSLAEHRGARRLGAAAGVLAVRRFRWELLRGKLS